MPIRDRPFAISAYDPPNTVPGQILLPSTLATDRHLQALYRAMSSVRRFQHTARDGKIPHRTDVVTLFTELYKSTLVSAPPAIAPLITDRAHRSAGKRQLRSSRPEVTFMGEQVDLWS